MQKQTAAKERTAGIAPYERIADDLRARIASGQWAVGAMLPGRRGLAQEYGVELPTLQRAVAGLLADGTLRADGTRGTFVAPRPGDAPTPDTTAATAMLTHPSASPRLGAHTTVAVIADLPPQPHRRGSEAWPETITKAVERTLARSGVTTRVFNLYRPHGPAADVGEAVESLLAEGVDAVVLALCSAPHEVPQAVAAAARAGVPLAFVTTSRFSHLGLSVYFDDQDAGFQAASHLIERGRADLLFFAPYTAPWVEQRLAGVRRAARLAGLPAVQASVSDTTPDQLASTEQSQTDAAYQAARALMAGVLPVRGVVAANDATALGFLRAAGEAGLTVGRDFALVGFDDSPAAREVGLTTFHPPLERLGEESGFLTLRALQGDMGSMQVCLHWHLVARSSSRLHSSTQPAPRFPLGQPEPPFPALPTSRVPTHERVTHHDTAVL